MARNRSRQYSSKARFIIQPFDRGGDRTVYAVDYQEGHGLPELMANACHGQVHRRTDAEALENWRKVGKNREELTNTNIIF